MDLRTEGYLFPSQWTRTFGLAVENEQRLLNRLDIGKPGNEKPEDGRGWHLFYT